MNLKTFLKPKRYSILEKRENEIQRFTQNT